MLGFKGKPKGKQELLDGLLLKTRPFVQKNDCFSPTADSFGVSAHIGSGVVWGGPEVRFHEGSTRVPLGLKRALHAVGDITRAYLCFPGA